MPWIEPVTDRDYSDIKNAIKMIDNRKKSSTAEYSMTKAFVNYSDLNRIEGNSKYLSEILGTTGEFKSTWTTSEVPLITDMSRILSNARAIRTKFLLEYPSQTISNVPQKLTTFSEFNLIEKVLLEIYLYISEIPVIEYDETKIAIIEISTQEIQYFSNISSAKAEMQNHTDKLYHMHIGDEVSFQNNMLSGLSGTINLVTIDISDKIETIGISAFEGCTALERITIPDSVTRIRTRAFKDCTSLDIISFGTGLVQLGDDNLGVPVYGCFSGSAISRLIIPENVTDIGSYAFYHCENLSAIQFNEKLWRIGAGAFMNCGLVSISIPDTVTSIESNNSGGGAFAYNADLEYIKFPKYLEEIEGSTCAMCTALETVVMPENLLKIGGGAFFGCHALTAVQIPDSVTIISEGAFNNCYGLQTVHLPESLLELSNGTGFLGEGTFDDCYSLQEITIPTNTRAIGSNCFIMSYHQSYTPSLKKITVKNRKKSIAGDPWGAKDFVSTEYAETHDVPDNKYTVTWAGASANPDLSDADRIILCELDVNGCITRIDKSIDWISAKNTMATYSNIDFGIFMTNQAPVHTIPEECFKDMANLIWIEIPSKFTEIGLNAFSGCQNLEYIEIEHHKCEILGEPWGASAGTEIYYAAELTTENGDILETASSQMTARVTDNTQTINTMLSGISAETPVNPVSKTLYILKQGGAFELKLGAKERSWGNEL